MLLSEFHAADKPRTLQVHQFPESIFFINILVCYIVFYKEAKILDKQKSENLESTRELERIGILV